MSHNIRSGDAGSVNIEWRISHPLDGAIGVGPGCACGPVPTTFEVEDVVDCVLEDLKIMLEANPWIIEFRNDGGPWQRLPES